jgi:hypothetical protein
MAAVKKEAHISQPLDQISAKFQLKHVPIFMGTGFKRITKEIL